jgi:hypothetical protein
VGDLLDRSVESVDDGDDFGAQTGRHEDRFVDIALTQQAAKDLVPFVLENGRSLEEV